MVPTECSSKNGQNKETPDFVEELTSQNSKDLFLALAVLRLGMSQEKATKVWSTFAIAFPAMVSAIRVLDMQKVTLMFGASTVPLATNKFFEFLEKGILYLNIKNTLSAEERKKNELALMSQFASVGVGTFLDGVVGNCAKMTPLGIVASIATGYLIRDTLYS